MINLIGQDGAAWQILAAPAPLSASSPILSSRTQCALKPMVLQQSLLARSAQALPVDEEHVMVTQAAHWRSRLHKEQADSKLVSHRLLLPLVARMDSQLVSSVFQGKIGVWAILNHIRHLIFSASAHGSTPTWTLNLTTLELFPLTIWINRE